FDRHGLCLVPGGPSSAAPDPCPAGCHLERDGGSDVAVAGPRCDCRPRLYRRLAQRLVVADRPRILHAGGAGRPRLASVRLLLGSRPSGLVATAQARRHRAFEERADGRRTIRRSRPGPQFRVPRFKGHSAAPAAELGRAATPWRFLMHLLRCLPPALVAAALTSGTLRSSPRVDPPPDLLIGYTELRTDLPGGRYVNEATKRAAAVKADGTGRRVLAEELTREAGSWTQFVGWSPDGKAARLSRNWKSEEVGKWEEEHKTFRPVGEGFRRDTYLVELASGKATKQAPVQEQKSELIKSLVHGRSSSPDGKRCAFEAPAYRLFLADADGSNARQVQTGLRFHLMPSWSPDGSWVLFVAGEHYDCHPHVLKADGTGL